VLETALQAFDRMTEARKLIDQDGAVTSDRFGQLKVHPALVVERDSRYAMLAALKQLNLDLEPPWKARPARWELTTDALESNAPTPATATEHQRVDVLSARATPHRAGVLRR
jgi:hypothetical protein